MNTFNERVDKNFQTLGISPTQEANSIRKWQEIRNFEDILLAVSRNRKMIYNLVMKKEASEVVTAHKRQLAYQI